MSHKLTVLIPCKDEKANIGPCIESIRHLADEILVADSGSTDGTLEVVRQFDGCRIVEREYVHSGDFKNWAIPQASHDWVLLIDADERVSDALADEIGRLLAGHPTRDGYWIGRDNYFFGRHIRFCGWQSDKVLRLFRRDLGRYVGDTDHAEIVVPSGKTGRLIARLHHFTYNSYDEYFRKFHRYTTFQALQWHRSGRHASVVRLLLTCPLRFLQTYFIRLGFLDGLAGIQVCMLTGLTSFMKQARLWELDQSTGPSNLERTARDPDAEAKQQSAGVPTTSPVRRAG